MYLAAGLDHAGVCEYVRDWRSRFVWSYLALPGYRPADWRTDYYPDESFTGLLHGWAAGHARLLPVMLVFRRNPMIQPSPARLLFDPPAPCIIRLSRSTSLWSKPRPRMSGAMAAHQPTPVSSHKTAARRHSYHS